MELEMILPPVRPEMLMMPDQCPYEDCDGRLFKRLQVVERSLRDVRYHTVTVHRYRCLSCGRTFRVYPQGVGRGQFSSQARGLATLSYFVGLSYDSTSSLLGLVGVPMAKSTVHGIAKSAIRRMPELKREKVLWRLKMPTGDDNAVKVKVKGEWHPLSVDTDDEGNLVLSVGELDEELARTLQEQVQPIAQALGVTVRVSEDQDEGEQEAATPSRATDDR